MSYIEDNGYFVFDGVKSSNYGVWINGGGTFNAPARRYNEYVIPGRNGTLTIDSGAFEDQEVTYPSFIVENFASNIEAFRNELMARNGYVRMTDSYHPDEYYMAKYMSGLEANVLPWGRAGSFDLTFKRDPRRFLISGETPVSYPPGAGNGKNLMQFPYVDTSKTAYGIIWSVDDAGVITVSGQKSSGIPAFNLSNSNKLSTTLTNGETYILSGCPEGGGSSTYRLTLMKNYTYTYDYGDGIEFIYDSSATYSITANIYTSAEIENVVFKPMIRKATDSDGWEPYYDGATHIYNPTLFASNPIIRVTGSGTLTVGSDVIAIRSGYNYVDINSEIQDCYCGVQNANSVVTFQSGKYPQLKPGISGVSGTGFSSIQITPNWYRL